MKITDIKIKRDFECSKPSEEKLEFCRKYFKENGEVDFDIIVNESNYLIDGYIRYLVLKENGIENVDVIVHKTCQKPDKRVYVYGYHSDSGKEYVWKLPLKIKKSEVSVGNKMLVRTKHGISSITVTRIEELSEPPVKTPIRKAVRCIEP